MKSSKKDISDITICDYLKNAKPAFILFDSEYYPICWNDYAAQLLKKYLVHDPNATLKTYLNRIFSEEEHERFSIFMNSFSKSASFEFSVDESKGFEKEMVFKFTASKQDDGNLFVILDDITKQKVKEQFLINAKQDAEKASSMRSLFLANVSHEIRTPIQTIIGMMDLINDTKLDHEQEEYVRQVNFSAEVLLALVNDVLDFSKLESGKMSIEHTPFNLTDSIEQTVDLISMEAHKKNLEVLVDIDTALPDYIIGDPARLRQVLLNFVKNAVKFTSEGVVSVSVRIIDRNLDDEAETNDKNASILFEVADTGIGVRADQKDKIFKSFYQGNAAINRKYGGTGLGLAISKNIVSMMGGEVGLRDNFQTGSVFWFKIPLICADKKAPHENMLLSERTRFLIVDDNMQTRSVLKRMLFKFGFEDITTVSSGTQALEIMKMAKEHSNIFDIVFIDMIMPEMDGWRLGSEIHNDEELKDSKLYLMIPEGSLGADAKMKMLEWFSGYLYKPLKRRLVFDLLNDIYRKFFEKNDGEEITELEPLDPTLDAKTKNELTDITELETVDDQCPLDFKILIVDDHPVNKKLLQLILEKEGYIVSTAENGQEAIDIASKEEFQIIFMDIQMPVLNGYEATQILREKNYTKTIIACTAGSQENEKELCESFGMNDIITKPFNKKQLLEMIKKYSN